MTAARIVPSKAAPLANRSSARNLTARIVAIHAWRSARAELPFNAFPLGQLTPINPKQQLLPPVNPLNPSHHDARGY